VFHRKAHPKSETWILGYTFENWQKISHEKIDPLAYPKRAVGDSLTVQTAAQWEERKKIIRQRIAQVLGEEPPRVPFPLYRKLSEISPELAPSNGWLAVLFNRPTAGAAGQLRLKDKGMGVAAIPFGDGLKGDLYYPLGPDGKPKPGKWPVVIWLHPYSYQNGWSAGRPWNVAEPAFVLDERPSFASLTRRGFGVFAFDQLGFGSRVHEAKSFYERYPKWSILGNMIDDTRSAIDALAALDEIDSSRIFLAGYALGAKVGLLTAASDHRIKGLVSVCGFDPLRLDTADKGTEGIRHYSHLHGLVPRLGFFVGHEDRLPFDFDEVLALAAPTPVLLVAPTLDRYARIADVRREVEASQGIYRLLGAENALQFETPFDINRFPRRLQERAFDWILQTSAR